LHKTVRHLADIFLITETHLDPDAPTPDIPHYTCFSFPRPFKHPNAWSASGGIAFYVKSKLAPKCTIWKIAHDSSYAWIKVSQISTNDLCICVALVSLVKLLTASLITELTYLCEHIGIESGNTHIGEVQ
jgi:hypothetical protein